MNLGLLMNRPILASTDLQQATYAPAFATEAIRDSFPLGAAKVGDQVIIVDAKGGKATRRRLMAMGMADGTELTVLQHHNNSGVVVCSGNRRFALEMSLACRILVTSHLD